MRTFLTNPASSTPRRPLPPFHITTPKEPTMAVLNDLPNELLCEILSNLRSTHLTRVARVSPRLYAVCMPLLYKAPTVMSEGRTSHFLERFTRTLLSQGHESLANHVTSLKLRWDHHDDAPELTPRIAAYASRRGLLSLWMASQDVRFCVLLHLLPRLSVLNISAPHYFHAFEQFMRAQRSLHPAARPLGFQNLRELYCVWNNHEQGITRKALVVFMGLPSIRTINVPISEESYPHSHLPVPPTSPVTDITLYYDSTTIWSVPRFLQLPIALQRFTFHIDSPDGGFHLQGFGRAMKPLRQTLQYLHLDFSELGDTDSDESFGHATVATIGSLRDWPMLRTVITSLMPLLGRGLQPDSPRLVDVLPRGIRNLEIKDDYYWEEGDIVSQAMQLLAEKQLMVPMLEKLAGLLDFEPNLEYLVRMRLGGGDLSVTFVDDTGTW